jgi:hypothetical protein
MKHGGYIIVLAVLVVVSDGMTHWRIWAVVKNFSY